MKIERFDLKRGEAIWPPIFLVELQSIEDYPASKTWPSEHIRVLAVVDSTAMGYQTISDFICKLIDQGCALFHAAGADGSRLDTCYDLEFVQRQIDGEALVDHCMTMWSTDDPVEEYLWEFLFTFRVSGWYPDTTKTDVIVVIDEPHTASRLREIFANDDWSWEDGLFMQEKLWQRIVKAFRNSFLWSKMSRRARISMSASSD